MIELAIGGGVILVGVAILLVLVMLSRLVYRGGKKGVAAGAAAVTLLTAAEQRLRHKQLTDGELFDHAKAIGDELVKRGKMTGDKWQPIFEQIATSLTHADAPPPQSVESEVAA